jgi:hypothetical protein
MKSAKQFTIVIIFILASSLTMLSCKKHNPVPITEELTADATVINSGDPAADGCGWLIKISGTDSTYSPKNLPVLDEIANLKVHITYKRLSTKFQCGWLPGSGPTQIQLDAVIKQ